MLFPINRAAGASPNNFELDLTPPPISGAIPLLSWGLLALLIITCSFNPLYTVRNSLCSLFTFVVLNEPDTVEIPRHSKMSMNSSEDLGIRINTDSLIRRLTNLELKLKKMEKKDTKKHQEKDDQLLAMFSEPAIRSPSTSPSDGEQSQALKSADPAVYTEWPNPEKAVPSLALKEGQEDLKHIKDDQASERRPVYALGWESPTSSQEAELLAMVRDPNVQLVPIDPSGPELNRDNSSFLRREGQWAPLYSPTHSSRSFTDSSIVSGYISPSETRSPGGMRKWDYREFQAYVDFLCPNIFNNLNSNKSYFPVVHCQWRILVLGREHGGINAATHTVY
jgi:hypothetical protein